jgi:hypothetical protein
MTRGIRAAAAAMVLLLASCSGGPTPRATAEGYLGALANLDFGAASSYVADDGRANFEFLRKLYDGLGPEERKKFQVSQWSVDQISENGDSATVDFTFDKVKKGELSLTRVAGIWKVDHRKTF